MSSAHWQIFVITRVFDIVQVDNILQKCYWGGTSLPTRIIEASTHWAFTCSKSAIETLEQGVEFVKVNIKETKKTSNDAFLESLLLTFYIALVNSTEFEQVNAGCAEHLKKAVFKNSYLVK